MEVTMDGEGPRMGGDAELNIVMQNSSSEHCSIILHSRVSVVYYMGVHKATVKKDITEVDLQPSKTKVLEWTLEYDNYKDKLVDQAALVLTLSGRVRETADSGHSVQFLTQDPRPHDKGNRRGCCREEDGSRDFFY
ncbi:hypothetical protein LDENG_00101280 [Lucifuga dentata]|nr:hypothetical protein LDENG_00101280 [Lucifuga dentata]